MIGRALAGLLILGLTVAPASAQTPARYAGRPLADVLRDLRTRGLNVVYSSELVKPDMRVAAEPAATSPRKILDEVLKPHNLRVATGVGSALLVVRAQRKAVTAEPPVMRTGAIQGKVVDKRTGVPLPGVTVTVQGTPLTTVTGTDGTFAFEAVPAEPQALFVSLVGFGLARPLVGVDPGKTTEVTVALADGLGSYSDEVTVVADPFRGADAAVPSQHTLTNADMQDLRGVLTDDPFRAVQVLPGVATGDDFRSEFSVRASDFRHIGLSFDGIPMGWLVHLTRALQDTGSVSLVNGDVIEHATLLSGAYPQRAPGRTGAWLSFDLREGSRTSTQGHLSVSGTSSSFTGDGPIGSRQRGSWLLSIRQSYLQWLLHKIDPSGGSTFAFSDVAGKLTYDLTPRQTLRVSLLAGRSKLEEDSVNPDSVSDALNHTSVASLSWQLTFSKGLFTQRAAVMKGDFTNTGSVGQQKGKGRESSGWYVADVRADLGRGLLLTAGGTVERSTTSFTLRQFASGVTPGSVILTGTDSLSQAAWTTHGYAGLGWQHASGATVDGGVAVSRSSQIDQSPISAWVLAARPISDHGLTARAGASLSWQLPDLFQLARYGGQAPIKAERAISIDAAVEQRLSPDVRWQVTFYSRRERDGLRLDGSEPRVIDDIIVTPSMSQTWRNALVTYSRGVEVMIQRRAATKVAGWISYSYGRARVTDAAQGESFWADFDQRHAFNAYALIRLSPKTSLSGKMRLGSNFPLTGYFSRPGSILLLGRERNTERLPSYARVDMRLNHVFTFTKRRLTLFAEVMNLLARTNYGPTDGFIRSNGLPVGFTEKLMPFLPSVGFVFDF